MPLKKKASNGEEMEGSDESGSESSEFEDAFDEHNEVRMSVNTLIWQCIYRKYILGNSS